MSASDLLNESVLVMKLGDWYWPVTRMIHRQGSGFLSDVSLVL